MVRFHYREGVTLDKKKSRWFLIFISLVVFAVAAYVAVVYLSPRLVTIPFTDITADATYKKIDNSKAGQFGDRLFLPQINVDIAIHQGGDRDALRQGAWQRNPALGDPAEGGNFALSAYKFTLDSTPWWTRAKSPFFNLDKITKGDELTVDFKGIRYVYKVNKIYQALAGTVIEKETDGTRLTVYAVNEQGDAVTGPVVEATLLNPPQEQAVSFGNTLGSDEQ